jgi:hypothetical protein
MTLGDNNLSKDTFPYRKGGFCKYCECNVTCLWSHYKTKKHQKNNPNFQYELEKTLEEIKKENDRKILENKREMERRIRDIKNNYSRKRKYKKKIITKKIDCKVESSDDGPIILFGE